ncbi:MAG TPA: transcriptional repressor LexA [Ignavibacteriaceae bacterium]|nr:transcriptional repressor LexA [Ignavibacteriaceae bacterium]
MKKQLTDRQEEILSFIEKFLESNGYPPTLREIGKKFEISSTFGVKRHLDALVKKGFVKIEGFASRGITLLHQNADQDSAKDISFRSERVSIEIPIVGRVAAGIPMLATENIEGNIVIDSSYLRNSDDCFGLRVKGDSMINAGIFEGDILIVRQSKQANNGEIVVALLDDEATVKRYEKKNDRIRLLPENSAFQPIEVNESKEFSIIGKVAGVIRWFK